MGTPSSQPASEHLTGRLEAGLRVYLLGPPKVEWAAGPLRIPRREVRALLYRLAMRLQPVPRDRLCFLFWPDAPESTARRNLSHLLTHLRNALPAAEVLLTRDDQVSLDPRRAWSDTATFERLYAAREGHGRAEALQQIVDLYGEPFLTGFSLPDSPEFEEWAARERLGWQHLYLEALAALIDGWTTQGEYETAIAYTQRYLVTDDLAEDMHRRLIYLYAIIGDRGAALRQFERCAAAVERELGLSPLPETRAIYQAILEGKLPSLRHPAPPLSWTTLPSLDTPLVGREDALRQIERAYALARAGRGRVVLISGEAGIGKSRLMQDFVTRLKDEALILAGASQTGEQAIPYHPIVEALRSTLNAESHPFNIQRIWLAELSRLLPELRDRDPKLPLPLPAESDEARARLFEALCQLTLALATGPRPLILCLDDLHLADGATLDWLVYLGRRLHSGCLLVIGTYRSEESEPVVELRHSLARRGIVWELRLSGLGAADVLQLLRHLVGPKPGAEILARRLRRATGGNPFFLLETLRTLIEADRLPEDLASLEDIPLPLTVQEAVEARLARLSPKARQVLEAGAILGTTFSFDLVLPTSGRRELETMDGLDELAARQLLVERASGYRFQHDITRRAVEAGLSSMRRQLLHRRAARALERLDRQAVAALAYHFDAGAEASKALHYHTLAARRAAELFAWQETQRHQTRILELLDRVDPRRTDPDCLAQRGQVLSDRAHLHFLQARLSNRDADLAVLTALAEASGNESLRLQALTHRVRYLNLDGHYEEAIAAAEEGSALAERLGDVLARTRFLAQIGFAHYLLGQPRPALAALESALTTVGAEIGPEMRGRVAHILGYVYLHVGDYTRALAYQEEAFTCHRSVGDHNRMAWDGLDIGFLHLKLGHFAQAERHLTESLALARQIGARPPEAYALTYLGYWELYRGRHVAAVDYFGQARPLQENVHSEHGITAAEGGLGLALYHLGDYSEARRLLRSAIERARTVGHRRRLAEALVGLALVELACGELKAAESSLTEAVALARASECREALAAGLAAVARLKRRQGDLDSALAHAGEAVRVAQETDLAVCAVWGEMEVALTLLAQGEHAAALEHIERAVALLPRAHEGWIGTEQVHQAHACVLQVFNRVEAAEEESCRAGAVVKAKADHIPDPERRQRYLDSCAPGSSASL